VKFCHSNDSQFCRLAYIEVMLRKPMEELILVATKGGPTMLARIGVMRALNRHVERVFEPSGKKHLWGKRKLKRDL
jgi:hypothetical protein